jgi:transposase
MANHLTMALIDTILTLRQRRWSQRKIARELGIDRETVARYLHAHAAVSPPAQATSASDALGPPPTPAHAPLGTPHTPATSKPAHAPLGSAPVPDDRAGAPPARPPDPGPGRASDCEPWRALICAKLDLGLSAQRIFQDLAAEHGFVGRYYSVRRFVRRLEQHTPLPFRRLECGPGEEAQVDFGQGAPVVTSEGRRRRPHVFRIVLCHSRKAYSEAVYRQTTEDFIRCLENAFWAFGGAPQRLILDYVPGHIIEVMCPASLCVPPAASGLIDKVPRLVSAT